MPLTIGMAVYNEEKHIAEAVESLLAQTYKDFTLLIVDNASTDRTEEICRNYAQKDKRIVYLKNERNMGAFFSFCRILENTNTPFFVLCGGHDRWDPSFVEKLLPELGKDNVVLSYCQTREINYDGIMGEVLKSDYGATVSDSPVKRYLYLLVRLNYSSGIFYGIWLTKTFKNCNFNVKTIGPDNILLERASLEGKFKQHKEILFWMRSVRGEETQTQMIKRQSVDLVAGESAAKANVIALKIKYLIESARIIFEKKYSLSVIEKIWLAINMFFIKGIYFFIWPAVKAIFRKVLPNELYSRLRIVWHKKIIKI